MAKNFVLSDSAELIFSLYEKFEGKKLTDVFDKTVNLDIYLNCCEDTTVFSSLLFRYLAGTVPLETLDKIADRVTLIIINDNPVNSLWDCYHYSINVPFFVSMRKNLMSFVKRFTNAKVITYTEYLKGDFA